MRRDVCGVHTVSSCRRHTSLRIASARERQCALLRIVSPTSSSGDRERSRPRLYPLWSSCHPANRRTTFDGLATRAEKRMERKASGWTVARHLGRPLCQVGGPCLIEVVTHLMAPSSDCNVPHGTVVGLMSTGIALAFSAPLLPRRVCRSFVAVLCCGVFPFVSWISRPAPWVHVVGMAPPLRGCAALRAGEVVDPDHLVHDAIQTLASFAVACLNRPSHIAPLMSLRQM